MVLSVWKSMKKKYPVACLENAYSRHKSSEQHARSFFPLWQGRYGGRMILAQLARQENIVPRRSASSRTVPWKHSLVKVHPGGLFLNRRRTMPVGRNTPTGKFFLTYPEVESFFLSRPGPGLIWYRNGRPSSSVLFFPPTMTSLIDLPQNS